MSDKLYIIGAGGHGKVVADIALKMKRWNYIAFFDDDKSKNTCLGIDIIGTIEEAISLIKDEDYIVAIGNNKIREKIQEELEVRGASIVSLIHPNAVLGQDVKIGKGSVVMAGVVINSSTVIGKGCIINTCCSIDHDNIIEDYVHISPGARLAGMVNIGKNCWICIGSVVSNNVKICKDSIIGAGAVVIKNITEPGTYIGVPARLINK